MYLSSLSGYMSPVHAFWHCTRKRYTSEKQLPHNCQDSLVHASQHRSPITFSIEPVVCFRMRSDPDRSSFTKFRWPASGHRTILSWDIPPGKSTATSAMRCWWRYVSGVRLSSAADFTCSVLLSCNLPSPRYAEVSM